MKPQFWCALITMAVCSTVGFAEGGAMEEALRKRDTAAVKAILEHNPNAANEPDATGNLPLYSAMTTGDAGVVDLLLGYQADPTLKNNYGQSSIYYALRQGDKWPYLRVFLEKGANPDDQDKDGNSLLCVAVSNDLPQCVELLLAFKAHVDLQNRAGDAPMHAACALKKWAPMLELLLAKDPNVNLVGRNGETPLHIACRRGDMDLAKVLLDHKADPNLATATRSNEAPIHYCAKYPTESAGALAALLLAAKADPNCRDAKGQTPMHLAAIHNGVAAAKALVAAGADANARDTRNRRTPLEVAKAVKAYPNAEIRDYLSSIGAAAEAKP